MNVITTVDKLSAWLKKLGWPEHPSNSFIFAISPDNGKIPQEAYRRWDGEFSSIPRDKKLVFKREDLKSYVHLYLDSSPSVPVEKGKEEKQSYMIPPEIVREKQELSKLRESLLQRERELRDAEADLRVQECEVKKSQAMTVRIGRELDERAKSISDRLKEYEEHLERKKKNDEEYLRSLNEALSELSDLKEKHLIFNQVVYTIDKIASSMAIRSIKNLGNDELKKLPPGFIDDLQKFIADRAERHFLASVPEPFMLVGESFMRLPTCDDKYHLCQIIMGWLVEQDINQFNRIGKEVIEAYKEKRQQQGN